MPVFMGRNASDVPTFAMGSNSATLHNYPPDASLVFRSDLPYILANEYTVSTYVDTVLSIGTVRYFTLPVEVRAAMSSLQVVLFYWIKGTTTIACTPQFSAESWYGSMWGWIGDSNSYINKNFALFNPSFVSGSGGNWSSSSVDNGATTPTLTASNPVLFNTTETKIGFPLFANRTFSPLQLRCIVLPNLKYTSSTNPKLIHSKLDVTSSGIKISKNQFLINGIDFRTKSLLVYSNSSVKPTNTTGITDVSSNLATKYPGISTYTSNKLFSISRTEYRADSTGDKANAITPSQYNILSGITDQGTSIIGATGFNTFRTTSDPVVSDFKVPVFGVMRPDSASASIEIDSRTSTLKFGGSVYMGPSIRPLYLISAGKLMTYGGTTYSKNFTSGTDLLTEVLLGTLTGVFNSNTSLGCGILTVYSSTQADYNHNTYVTTDSGNSFFNLQAANMLTTNHTCMHSCLVQLSEAEKLTLFTTALNSTNLEVYVGATQGGISTNVFLKRVGNSLQVYARFDDGGLNFAGSTSYGSTFKFNTKITIPAFSFSFTELQ